MHRGVHRAEVSSRCGTVLLQNASCFMLLLCYSRSRCYFRPRLNVIFVAMNLYDDFLPEEKTRICTTKDVPREPAKTKKGRDT